VTLGSLPPLLRAEPAMVDLLSAGSSVVAVPEVASAFVVASLSWRFFETPFLRLKNRFTVNSQAIIKFSLPPI